MRGKFVPAAVALLAIVGSGVLNGLWTDRWGLSEALSAAVRRLEGVPRDLGPWRGEDMPINPRHRDMAEIRGHVLRRYAREGDGATVSLLLVCGRPGPIAAHSPQVCYGAGYDLVADPVRVEVPAVGRAKPAAFWVADFRQRDAPAPRMLRIYWGWNAGSGWEAATSPRLRFGGAPVLHKVYVVRDVLDGDEPPGDDPSVEYLRRLLPELEATLFAPH